METSERKGAEASTPGLKLNATARETLPQGVGRAANSPRTLNLRDKTAILVVDDERFIRLVISTTLKSAGYVPVEAASVEEAMQILREHPHAFSAVISDIMTGNMDGFDFRNLGREQDKSMPFFFMTALDPEEGSGFLKRIVTDPLSY